MSKHMFRNRSLLGFLSAEPGLSVHEPSQCVGEPSILFDLGRVDRILRITSFLHLFVARYLEQTFQKKKLAAISPSIVFFMMRRNSSCNTVVSPKMVGTHRNSSNTRNSEKKQFAIENPDFFLINTISNGGFFSLLYELIPECQMSILVHKEHQETLRFVGK